MAWEGGKGIFSGFEEDDYVEWVIDNLEIIELRIGAIILCSSLSFIVGGGYLAISTLLYCWFPLN
jgi:hypothetical protein